jgi:hypothetical protein
MPKKIVSLDLALLQQLRILFNSIIYKMLCYSKVPLICHMMETKIISPAILSVRKIGLAEMILVLIIEFWLDTKVAVT